MVKEALVQAKLGDKYTSIYTATYGIAFFGTPHRGSSLAGIGDVFAKITRAVLRNPSNSFMTALKKDGEYARELFSNFQQLAGSFSILSVYETRPLKGVGLVVEKSSATFDLPDSQETQIALDCDHKAICKFSTTLDPNYDIVSRNIVALANAATQALEEQPWKNERVVDETVDSKHTNEDGPSPICKSSDGRSNT